MQLNTEISGTAAKPIHQAVSASDVYTLDSVFSWNFSFSQSEMLAFESLSQDHNPIHADSNFAKSKGFEGPVVYGVLLSTQISRLIGQELPDVNVMLVGYSIDFLKPAFIDQKLTFHAKLINCSDATGMLEFKCSIRDQESGKTLCKSLVRGVWRP